jgi:hypothetical protein
MKFKKGDICCYISPLAIYIFVFKKTSEYYIDCYIGYTSYDNTLFHNPVTSIMNIKAIRLATEPEKKILFKALEKQGKYWDEKELKLISEL